MGSSTVLLVLKSLLPFIREILLKDKLLKELFLTNKLATAMTGCVAVLFVLFLHMSSRVDEGIHTNALLTQKSEFQEQTIKSLEARVATLSEDCKRGYWTSNSPTDHHTPEVEPPTPPPSKPKLVKKKQTKAKESGKAQIAKRFKTFD